MTSITRILVPTDFSEPADAALDYAVDLSRTLGAHISLIHVFDDPVEGTLSFDHYVPLPLETRDLLARMIDEDKQAFARFCDLWESPVWLSQITRPCTAGAAPPTLSRLAARGPSVAKPGAAARK